MAGKQTGRRRLVFAIESTTLTLQQHTLFWAILPDYGLLGRDQMLEHSHLGHATANRYVCG